jgi:hypothetical protein
MDLLCSTPSPKLPEVLKVQDPLYKKAKKHLSEKFGRVNVALLYGSDEIFWVNPNGEKDFYGRLRGERIKKEDLTGEI